jgi:hypothetical protein
VVGEEALERRSATDRILISPAAEDEADDAAAPEDADGDDIADVAAPSAAQRRPAAPETLSLPPAIWN